jgi:hypothetical protein
MHSSSNLSLFTNLTSLEQTNLSGGASSYLNFNGSAFGKPVSGSITAEAEPGEFVVAEQPGGGTATAIGGNASQGGTGGSATASVGF